MPLHPFRLAPTAAVALLLAGPAAAQEARSDQPPTRSADAAIGGCESRYSDLLNSGEQQKMRRANAAIARCIRDAALENAVVLLGEDKRDRIAASFDQIEKGLEGFYRELYDQAAGSFHPSCASELREAYADIVHDVLRQRTLRQPM